MQDACKTLSPPPPRHHPSWKPVSTEQNPKIRKDVLDVVEAELVGILGRSNDTNPVTELVLLQELLGEVLEVALGDGDGGGHGDVDIAYTAR